MSSFEIKRREDIPTAIRRLQQAGETFRVPLLRAVYRGEIAHLELRRPGSARVFKRWAAATAGAPSLLLLGDDDLAQTQGPGTWPIAKRAISWAEHVILHAAAGQPEHYEAAIALTMLFRRTTMIECCSESAAEWQDAVTRWAPGTPTLMVVPRGDPHPVDPAELH